MTLVRHLITRWREDAKVAEVATAANMDFSNLIAAEFYRTVASRSKQHADDLSTTLEAIQCGKCKQWSRIYADKFPNLGTCYLLNADFEADESCSRFQEREAK